MHACGLLTQCESSAWNSALMPSYTCHYNPGPFVYLKVEGCMHLLGAFAQQTLLPRKCVKLASASKSHTLLWDFEAIVGWLESQQEPDIFYISPIVLLPRVIADPISASCRPPLRRMTSSNIPLESRIIRINRTHEANFGWVRLTEPRLVPAYYASVLLSCHTETQPNTFPLPVGHPFDVWRHQTYRSTVALFSWMGHTGLFSAQ
jgi:hypothetical protein